MSVVENIIKTCEELGMVELNGIKLETADPALLDVTEMDLDQHVAMQPAAIVYYGTLRKEALRALDNCRKAYYRWQKKQYIDAKAVVDSRSSAKSAVRTEEIKAQILIDHEANIESWENRMDRLQREVDTLDNWYEGWRQKSFTIREHAKIEEDERWNASPHLGGGSESLSSRKRSASDAPRSRTENVRRIMRERQDAKIASAEGKH